MPKTAKVKTLSELSQEFAEAMYKVGLITDKDRARYIKTFSGKIYRCQ